MGTSRRLMGTARERECILGSLRYFVIGNRTDGYSGIECVMNIYLRENDLS